MSSANPEDDFTLCEQRKRILDEDGHMLVVGGPGSGKTTIALLKARRRVLEQLNAGQKVLFLSFSNSAIRRIMESAGRILTDEVADHVEIKTYHSFAWEILTSHGYLTSSQRRMRILPAQDAAVRAAGLSKDEWRGEQDRLYIEEGLVTYDQFAPRAAELLTRSKAARACFCAAYPLILVDEFQDTDEEQWAIVEALSKKSEIIGLGDTEQRIFEWRPGVSETRLEDFGKALDCERFDFASENNRSPATGIAAFARSLLSPGSELDFPNEIVRQRFWPGRLAAQLHLAVRKSFKEAKERSDKDRPKIAMAARSKRLVRQISDALSANANANGRVLKALPHDVRIDQHQILLASRVITNILSNASGVPRSEQLAEALDRIADMLRSAANPTNIKASDRLRKWADKCRTGNAPKTKCVTALAGVMERINGDGLSGAPTQDWIATRRLLAKADASELKKVADLARYLRLLRRGSVIEQALIGLWVTQGNYMGAEAALEQAILQDQLVDSQRESATISVMNMHQLKGREYDAVVLVEDQYNTFMAQDKESPHADTRRLLQVSLTRAREFVVVVSSAGDDTFDQLLS
ncbi:UvrD-helicase domain-containing protein [Roseovarius sp. D22-M7]|uniref:UvrD-helicase domain-containing protein n=1 Tax=Roseovarius sp. D22-M7 TaxID=3127116 RepID=UPI00301030C5